METGSALNSLILKNYVSARGGEKESQVYLLTAGNISIKKILSQAKRRPADFTVSSLAQAPGTGK